MFWRQNIVVASHIETILEKEDVELEELLEEEDILNECKAQNKKLIDYLVQPAIMDKLVSFIVSEPDEQKVIKVRYKYANIACEILTLDMYVITDVLISQTLLNKLYSFLETEMPLNPLLASFFSKIMIVLLSKRNEDLMEFLKSKHNFVDLLLRHIEISAIAQLLLKFIAFTTMWTGILTWIKEQNIIQRLVSLIDPTFSRDVIENAAQLLCDTIRLGREHMSTMQEDAIPNLLLEDVESYEVIMTLLNNMLSEKRNEDVIVNGISVLLALLEFKKYACMGSQQIFNSFQLLNHGLQPTNSFRTSVSMSPCNDGPEQMTVLDAERLSVSVNNTVDVIITHLYNIHKALMDPPLKPPIKLTTGILDTPLGKSRLEISRLIVVLVSINSHNINNQLAKYGTVLALLNLFFKYKWNNFLHTQVELMIKRIISNPPTVTKNGNKVHPLLEQLISDFQITCKILECFDEQEQNLEEKNGYMGHLTTIANHIAEAVDTSVNNLLIEDALKNLPENHYENWKKFVNNTLSDINAKNNTPLIDMSTINTSDPFAFNDKLIESDESLPEHLNLSDVSFSNEPNIFQRQVNLEDNIFQKHIDLEESIFQKGEELFEQICQEKCHSSSPTDDGDSDEDVWVKDEKEIPFIQQNCHDDDDSSDSDDDNEKESHNSNTLPLPSIIKNYDVNSMDVESQNNWTSNLESVPMDITPVVPSNPWTTIEEKPSATSSEQDNWADFSNFTNFSASSIDCNSELDSASVAMDTTDVQTSKCFSNSELSSTPNTNISQAIPLPPPNNLSCEGFDTASIHGELISAVSTECDKLPCSSSVESASNVSLMEKDESKEPEPDSDCLKTEVAGQLTSAIVENGPT